MGLKIFGYSELSSDFGSWIEENCDNCGDNYDKIEDFFINSTWGETKNSKIRNYWNGKQHNNCPWPWSFHPDGMCSGDRYRKVLHWPPSYNISRHSEQDITIKKVDIQTIMNKMTEYLSKFKDINRYASENGLITYMNIIGRFMLCHFTFVSSIFSTRMLTIYTDTPNTVPEVPQNTITADKFYPPQEGTRNVVHHEPIQYYLDTVFKNVKSGVRKVNIKYLATAYDSNGGRSSVTLA